MSGQPTGFADKVGFIERFGLNLNEADRIWFEQQEAHLLEDDDVRVVALGNDLEQFRGA